MSSSLLRAMERAEAPMDTLYYVGDVRAGFATVWADRVLLAKEVKRLREEITDKLPKCWRLTKAGELVRDGSITPGMVLYRIVDARTIERIRVHSVTEAVVDTHSNGIRQAFTGSELYSTREAAKAVFLAQRPISTND